MVPPSLGAALAGRIGSGWKLNAPTGWCRRPQVITYAVVELVRAAGLEPAQALRPYGFSYQLRLSPPHFALCTRKSLWSGLSLHRSAARVRCCPSSLYTFSGTFMPRAWLGIAMSQVPPNLGSSASRVSPRALKLA